MSIEKLLEAHTAEDSRRFDTVAEILADMNSKLDEVRLLLASMKGAATGIKITMSITAALISLAISIAVTFFMK